MRECECDSFIYFQIKVPWNIEQSTVIVIKTADKVYCTVFRIIEYKYMMI